MLAPVTSKSRFLETKLATMFIYLNEIVLFREGIKKLLKKLLPTLKTVSDNQFANLQWMQQRQSDTTTQELSNLSLMSTLISITSCRWTPDCKSNIPFPKWSLDMTLSNGSSSLPVNSLFQRSRKKSIRKAMQWRSESTLKILSTIFFLEMGLWGISNSLKKNKMLWGLKPAFGKKIPFRHSMIQWSQS